MRLRDKTMLEVAEDNQILFEMPIEMELRKSEGGERRIVRGYASTESMDQDGEIILQNGIDFSPLLKSGFLNYDHYGKCLSCGETHDRAKCPACGSKGRMPIIIGVPLLGEIRDKGLWVEGELFKSSDAGVSSEQGKLADEMWALGMMLQKTGQRSLSYSVEGGVLQRHGKKIVKSLVKHLAVTSKPVNPEATIECLRKSMCCGRCNVNHPLFTPGHSCGSNVEPAEAAPMSKEDRESGLTKAMSTTTAGPMMLENLDRGISGTLYGPQCEHYGTDGRFGSGIPGAVEHLQKCRGYSKQQSINFLRKAIHNAPHRPDLAALVKQAGLIGN